MFSADLARCLFFFVFFLSGYVPHPYFSTILLFDFPGVLTYCVSTILLLDAPTSQPPHFPTIPTSHFLTYPSPIISLATILHLRLSTSSPSPPYS